jgi:RNA polymerase sigma-70 factor (ECF subfamily)
MCRQHAKAEDLAQEALAKAWKARSSFQPGTNLKAWLFTILRNELYSRARRDWRQTEWDQDAAERIPAAADAQHWHLELCDVADGLRSLPVEQREAVILIGAAGFSYSEAGEICGVPEGTVKSRVARGRMALVAFMEGGKTVTHEPVAHHKGGSADIMGQLAAIRPARGKRALPS